MDQVLTDDGPSTEHLIDINAAGEGGHVHVVDSNFREKDVQTDSQAERIEREEAQKLEQTKRAAEKKKAAAEQKAADVKAKARQEKEKAKENVKKHPVMFANGIITALGAIGVGYLGYTKHKAGELNWKLAFAGIGGIAAFSLLDGFVSRQLASRKSEQD